MNLVKKQIAIMLLNYGLGRGLLAWVVWKYWTIQGADLGTGQAHLIGQTLGAQALAPAAGPMASLMQILVAAEVNESGAFALDMGIGAALKKPIHWLPFLCAGLCCLTSMLLTFLRWFILVRAQDLPFTVPNAIRLGLIGYYLNTFLPGSVGGDIIKATFIAREQRRRTGSGAT